MEVIDEGKANRHVAVTSNFFTFSDLLNMYVPLLFSVIHISMMKVKHK